MLHSSSGYHKSTFHSDMSEASGTVSYWSRLELEVLGAVRTRRSTRECTERGFMTKA